MKNPTHLSGTKHPFVFGLLASLILTACSTATFENFNLLGSATDVQDRTIGKNTQKVYMTAGELDKVCDEQASLITTAGWKASEELRRETTYKTGTFSNEQSANLTLMCSQQENNAGIKVTLTLQKGA